MSIKRNFIKPPLDIDAQLSLLQERGIYIEDKEKASHYLSFIGYYRLSGYIEYLKKPDSNYIDGMTFDSILHHYIIDRKLRMILFDAIERVEIALKSIMTNVLSLRYGGNWFENIEVFDPQKKSEHDELMLTIQGSIKQASWKTRESSNGIKDYYEKYNAPALPPSWIIMEVLSLGVVSKMLSLLKVEARQGVAVFFKTKERHLVSWIRSLTYTRNLCAHHSRIWNRNFTIKLSADKTQSVCREDHFNRGKVYSQVAVLELLLDVIAPDNNFKIHVKELLATIPKEWMYEMGFPNEWKA